ncbi:hypothetical protein GRS96_18330 [Rathayibacter sp. VKM Ac-2803]|uniref:hypothetical protein n=1 Tax=unclassified Rathayibacter TaxID=2609250 RepID=UPI0013570355|nr:MULTISPECIES: hypothetical protein [unclassified Rathayibacter]MWV51231.1 hypothetical protein [Rathayibacter sp. VKM Ac-2803]MWV57715.1 hypothetical protein [Rathayibacter sp. VKM Ac-2754]
MRQLPRIRLDPSVPAPPFADAAASEAFHRGLAIHVAELGRASGGPHPETLAVCAAVGAGGRGAPGDPSAQVLDIALRTFFPASWTPASLVRAVRDVLPSRGLHWTTVRPDRLAYDADPRWVADRAADGSWSAQLVERGVARPDVTAADDDEMVVAIMAHVISSFPYPYGWVRSEDELLRRRGAAEEVVRAFALERRLPYLAEWT